jgi:hypothetical protein
MIGNRCTSSSSDLSLLVIRPATLTDLTFDLVTEPSWLVNNNNLIDENIDALQNEVAPIHVTDSSRLVSTTTIRGIALRSGGQ